MDDFDDARYFQGPGPVGGQPPHRAWPVSGARPAVPLHGMPLRQNTDCHEELVAQQGSEGTGGSEGHIRVRGLTSAGHDAVRAEMHLLAALEVDGVLAAPCVLTLEETGYVRECASSLDRRGGRRAAEVGSPATAEREALATARDHLDALIDALHERGWLLGATPGEGIGRRSDGSIVLLDLRGLRPGEDLSRQQADRHWVDSVLHDQERTLRRRVHEIRGAASGADTVSALPWASKPPWNQNPPGAFLVAPEAPADDSSLDGVSITGPATEDHDAAHVAIAAPAGLPTGAAGLRRARSVLGREPVRRRSAPLLRAGGVIREVLSSRGHRRTAILTAGAVLLSGAVIGTGASLMAPSPPQAEPRPPAAVATPSATDSPAPAITDPWALAAELAGSRHAYITGLSAQPIAAPGSPALAADEEVRAAYEGLIIEGGGPVIHEASVIEGASSNDTALLQVTTSTQGYEVIEGNGATRTVPATEPTVVELALAWDGEHWLVLSTRPVTDARTS